MNRSESITEIAKALVAFNGEVNKIAKDANNPMFRNNYATLDQIIAEIRPPESAAIIAVIICCKRCLGMLSISSIFRSCLARCSFVCFSSVARVTRVSFIILISA